jgi:hypothetical protein
MCKWAIVGGVVLVGLLVLLVLWSLLFMAGRGDREKPPAAQS